MNNLGIGNTYLQLIWLTLSILISFTSCFVIQQRGTNQTTLYLPTPFWSLIEQFNDYRSIVSVVPHIDSPSNELDLIYLSVDGNIGAVNNILCVHPGNRCYENTPKWEKFIDRRTLAEPISVPFIDEKILLVGHLGHLTMLTKSGSVMQNANIPSIFVQRNLPFSQLPITDSKLLTNWIEWDQNQNSTAMRLDPVVLSAPLILPLQASDQASAAHNRFTLLLAVNFVSSTRDDIGVKVLISGLLTFSLDDLPREATASRSLKLNRLNFIPLELSDSIQPGYLMSSPVLSADPMPMNSGPSASNPIAYSVLVTSTSSTVFRVTMPSSVSRSSTPAKSFSLKPRVSALTHPCIMLDCPATPPSLCCLLLDDHSSLHLLNVDRRLSSKTDHDHLLWSYTPGGGKRLPGNDQESSPVLVPVSTEPQLVIAAYLDSSSLLHAVNVADGRSVPNFPIQLTSNRSTAFTRGPGIVYRDENELPWILFMDRSGRFYHIQLPSGRILTDSECRFPDCEPLHSIAPSAITYHAASGDHSSLGLVVASSRGLDLVTFSRQRHRPFTSVPVHNTSKSKEMLFPLPSSTFLSSAGIPTDELSIHTDDQTVVEFSLSDCLSLVNNSSMPDTYYWTVLTDQFGSTISPWSLTLLDPHELCSTLVHKRHFFKLQSILGSTFTGRLLLHAIKPETGRIVTSSVHLGQPSVAGWVLFSTNSQWPRFLTCLAYLPALYLITTLTFVHCLTLRQNS